MSLTTKAISLLSTLLTIVTIPIYFLFLLTLHKNRHDEHLKAPFFRFIFSVGLANMGQICTNLLGNTLASSGFVPGFYIWMGGLSARLYNCALFCYGTAQIVGITIIAVNRLTAYIYPMKHTTIWTNSLTRNLIIFQWIFAVLVLTPIAFVFEYNIFIENDNRTIYYQWTNAAENELYTLLIGGLIGGLLTIIITVVYAIIFAVALIRKIRSHEAMHKTEKLALNMAAIGFICSVGLIFYLGDILTLTIAWNLFHYDLLDQDTNWVIISTGNSFLAAIDPYAILFFSSTVRKHFAAIVCFYRKKSVAVSSTTLAVTPYTR